jgi:hypothetical protein
MQWSSFARFNRSLSSTLHVHIDMFSIFRRCQPCHESLSSVSAVVCDRRPLVKKNTKSSTTDSRLWASQHRSLQRAPAQEGGVAILQSLSDFAAYKNNCRHARGNAVTSWPHSNIAWCHLTHIWRNPPKQDGSFYTCLPLWRLNVCIMLSWKPDRGPVSLIKIVLVD